MVRSMHNGHHSMHLVHDVVLKRLQNFLDPLALVQDHLGESVKKRMSILPEVTPA